MIYGKAKRSFVLPKHLVFFAKKVGCKSAGYYVGQWVYGLVGWWVDQRLADCLALEQIFVVEDIKTPAY